MANEKEVKILVNGRERIVPKKKITYEEIIALAFGEYIENPDVVYSISYSKGEDKKPKGGIVKGQDVMVKEGMIFNVTTTNKS